MLLLCPKNNVTVHDQVTPYIRKYSPHVVNKFMYIMKKEVKETERVPIFSLRGKVSNAVNVYSHLYIKIHSYPIQKPVLSFVTTTSSTAS